MPSLRAKTAVARPWLVPNAPPVRIVLLRRRRASARSHSSLRALLPPSALYFPSSLIQTGASPRLLPSSVSSRTGVGPLPRGTRSRSISSRMQLRLCARGLVRGGQGLRALWRQVEADRIGRRRDGDLLAVELDLHLAVSEGELQLRGLERTPRVADAEGLAVHERLPRLVDQAHPHGPGGGQRDRGLRWGGRGLGRRGRALLVGTAVVVLLAVVAGAARDAEDDEQHGQSGGQEDRDPADTAQRRVAADRPRWL